MDTADKISMCLLRIRARMPFFGALALFAEHTFSDEVTTAGTDGRSVIFNARFADSLNPKQLDAVMVHELLHAALLHPSRRGQRNPILWNIAADIVVNGIVRQEKELELPKSVLIDPKLEQFEVEEVYRILENEGHNIQVVFLTGDLLDPADAVAEGISGGKEALAAHWRAALSHAMALARQAAGKLPAGIERHADAMLAPQLDWRSILWRFVVRTPVDYADFDHRFVGRGLYLETLAGESVQLRVAVDTSGSISERDLTAFLAELREIVRLYPQLDAQVYYGDAVLYGPFPLDAEGLKRAKGGGGTSFVPFFKKMAEERDAAMTGLLIYLTDGHGTFPDKPPELSVLWVVAAGGLPSGRFPFGEVARLNT